MTGTSHLPALTKGPSIPPGLDARFSVAMIAGVVVVTSLGIDLLARSAVRPHVRSFLMRARGRPEN